MPKHQSRVLVVDDEPSVLAATSLLLQHAACQVQTASSGAEALVLLEKHCFDLLVTDNRMPVMSGVQLAMAAKKRSPTLPVLMLTAYPPPRPLRCLDEVLVKPAGLSLLVSSVKRLLRNGSGAVV